MRSILSLIAELAGVAAVTAGAYLVAPALGFVVGGIGLIALGVALDLGSPSRPGGAE